MGESKRRQSLPRKGGGFTVAASPFNAVKFDLAIILFVGVLLLIVHGSLSANPLVQLALLFLYGVGAMLWLLVRTRKIVKKIESEQSVAEKMEVKGSDGAQ